MSTPVSSTKPTDTQPPSSVLNMKVGDILKSFVNYLQQLSDSAKGLAQTETDPTTKAALTSVANTISPSNVGSTTPSPQPTTITVTQRNSSTSTSIPTTPSIPQPSTTYMTPQPSSK